MLTPEVRHIFRTERPTNFKLGVHIEYEEDLYRHERRDGPLPARSKAKIAMSRGQSDRSTPAHKSRTKCPRSIEIFLQMPRAIMHTSFKVKRSSSITAETKSVSYLPNGKAWELENWYDNRACAINCHGQL